METKWNVNVGRLISLLSSRMYSNVLYSGLKELVTNSLDARRGNTVRIQIFISPDSITYKDDGIGLSPSEFDKKFGEIASDHEREEASRGFFGIGRLGLLSQATDGQIYSYSGKNMYIWKFNNEGYSKPEKVPREGYGITLMYSGLKLEYDIKDLLVYLSKMFAIPLLNKECTIDLNNFSLLSLITDQYSKQEFSFKDSKIELWYTPESNGKKYLNHKGIGVLEEDYSGLVCFVNEDILNIKTDREGFINDKVYKEFRQILSDKLSELRPDIELEKMQIEFIQRLMIEFKRYWVTKKETGKMVKTDIWPKDVESSKEIVEENIPPVKDQDLSPEIDTQDLPELPSVDIQFPDDVVILPTHDEEIPLPEKKIVSIPEETQVLIPQIQEEKKEEPIESPKVVTIRGARPMDLGEDWPMIFFEKDPFVLIFNTSHPTFKKLVERGTLSSDKLAVLFERMFECAVISKDGEDINQVKQRWAEVDKNLKKVFK